MVAIAMLASDACEGWHSFIWKLSPLKMAELCPLCGAALTKRASNTDNNLPLSATETSVESTMSPVTTPINPMSYFFAKVHFFSEIATKKY